jgi:hypothetical protein
MDWKPIDTAPKGGGAEDTRDPKWVEPPRILAWSKARGLMIVYWDWYYAERGNGYVVGRTAWVSEGEALWQAEAPTHWMPLPTPPEDHQP